MTTTEQFPATPAATDNPGRPDGTAPQAPRISEATAAAWRRNIRRTMELPPDDDRPTGPWRDEYPGNGHPGNGQQTGGQHLNGQQLSGQHLNGQQQFDGQGTVAPAVPVHPAPAPPVAARFAESQQAGLTAMVGMASTEAMTHPVIRAAASPAAPGTLRPPDPPEPAPRAPVPAPARPSAVGGPRYAHLPGLSVMVCILTVQAVLSARLIGRYTAFNDEALYLWAGHLQWSHWLHGTPVPEFPTYFSGAPAFYPPIGALADSIGGLVAARLLSLCFMLGATVLLWSTATRLYGRRAGYFAAGLWAVLGPTQHLGAYATYDAMSLFLLALAAWCATGRRERVDATAWLLSAAAALALANGVKYATTLFDPVVIALAALSAWPRPGGKVALRRAALITTCASGLLALLIRLGGPLYLRGIEQTTLDRTGNTAPALTVLGQSWQWIGVVAVLAGAGLILSWRRPCLLLTAVLAGAVLLVPAEQARIHTVTSLNKHVDFGAWFAAIAAGYAVDRLAGLLRRRVLTMALVAACVTGLGAVCFVGVRQAGQMLYGYWPNEARLMASLRPLTAHGGRFLAEGQYIPAYYLRTPWQDWSNTRSVLLPDGHTISVPVGGEGSPAVYQSLIAQHYWSVVLLTFTDTVNLDTQIDRDLRHTRGYHIAAIIPFGPTRHGSYTIWVYQ